MSCPRNNRSCYFGDGTLDSEISTSILYVYGSLDRLSGRDSLRFYFNAPYEPTNSNNLFILLAPSDSYHAGRRIFLGLWILLFHVLLVAVTVVPSLQGFGPVVTKYCTKTKTAWLTIDDGPIPQHLRFAR
jgi:hypothetical protein